MNKNKLLLWYAAAYYFTLCGIRSLYFIFAEFSYRNGGENAKMAHKVISALGVYRKNGRYAKGALRLLADKLG